MHDLTMPNSSNLFKQYMYFYICKLGSGCVGTLALSKSYIGLYTVNFYKNAILADIIC